MSINNATELREDMLAIYEKIKSGQIDLKTAKELNNCAGKIINSAKVQVEYAVVRNEKPNIEFLK